MCNGLLGSINGDLVEMSGFSDAVRGAGCSVSGAVAFCFFALHFFPNVYEACPPEMKT